MKRLSTTFISLILALTCAFALAACGANSSDDPTDSSMGAEEAYSIYQDVVSADRIDIGTAYMQLKDLPLDDADALAFVNTLGQLVSCQGRYLQISESTSNIYTADVSFYVSHGDVWCSINYTNYRGTIADGQVSISTDEAYWFEVTPQGRLKRERARLYPSHQRSGSICHVEVGHLGIRRLHPGPR